MSATGPFLITPPPSSGEARVPWGLTQGLHWAVRVALAGLFVWTGLEKAIAPGAFAEAIRAYHALPDPLVRLAAVGLPVLELVAAAALLVPSYAQGAAWLTAGMLALFAGAMAQSRLRGIDLDCGCFGAGVESRVSWLKVTLNVALAMLALWTSRARITLGRLSRSSTPS